MNQTYINQHVSWRLMMVVVMLFVSASSKKIIFGAYNVNFYFMEHLPRLIKILGVFFYFL